jgi:cell division protein FtsW (lipid II flippase)
LPSAASSQGDPVVTAVAPAPPTRRTTEAVLLVFAVVVSLAAYASVGYVETGHLPASLAAYGAGLCVLVLIAHGVVRIFAPYADPLMLPAAALLNGLGLVMIYRIDLARASQPGDPGQQLAWTALGIGLFCAVLILIRDHRTLSRYTYTAMFVGIVLLALPAVLPAAYSPTINGSRIWIRVAGFSIQPGEFAKLLLIISFAGYLVAKRDVLALASRRVLGLDLPRGRDLGPILVAWGASLLILIREKDLGTSLLFFGVFVVLLYIATERLSWLLFGVMLFASGAFVAYHLFSHVALRVDTWLNPEAYYQSGQSYQLMEGLFGLASGGILGSGLGQGLPARVPYASTDFIIAAFGEELGLTGLMAILLLYAILVERGVRAAIGVRDPFGKLLAAGLAFSMALQVFVVVGGVTGLIPLTGLTTPFLSYGGSSLVANWALVALLLRISDAARRPIPIQPEATITMPTAPDDATQVMKT